MPNIAVTAFCNLRCPYCFADDMICEQSHNITIERFREILSWVARTPENHIGIIGGEPTIHPQFSDILREVNQYCRELRTSATLFTNGIYLDKYLPEIGNSTGILINCNGPDYMTAEQWTKFNATLEHLHLLDWFHPGQERANLGCNIFINRKDYTYIWQIVDKYHVQRLRTSVTSPTAEYRGDKHRYFADLKPIFMDFVEKALERQIILGMDCSQIPNCYFSEAEMEKVLKVMPEKDRPNYCEPVIDITPEFTATACFGCYDPVDCRDFPTVIDLRRYMLHRKNYPRMVANIEGRCANCRNHELMLCQGGCLGFADMNKVQLVKDVVDTVGAGGGCEVKHKGNPNKTVYSVIEGVQPAIAVAPAAPDTCGCGSCYTPGGDTSAPVATSDGQSGEEINAAGMAEAVANTNRVCVKDCNACTSRCGMYGMYQTITIDVTPPAPVAETDATEKKVESVTAATTPATGTNSFGEQLTNMTMTPAEPGTSNTVAGEDKGGESQ